MANAETALKEALASIKGATGAALIDYASGTALGTIASRPRSQSWNGSAHPRIPESNMRV
ncbi:hypothetical protein B7755_036955 [Streptomyces sp. NBS 14/10]|uniref:hypothetical protein n=1 Tax=Streptomyces sp. NBS 14/10 TaxID=1945643 RepID=UPI000B9D45C7|nr:hypothetical protein [Streptomyces sp. NBS 14/10]KAK1186550.1 hypothetical protein B7755_036955 [Streptomyces sp. NBS 14/10]NUS81172.1 hypothetical protein [Streptomyces sp.]